MKWMVFSSPDDLSLACPCRRLHGGERSTVSGHGLATESHSQCHGYTEDERSPEVPCVETHEGHSLYVIAH